MKHATFFSYSLLLWFVPFLLHSQVIEGKLDFSSINGSNIELIFEMEIPTATLKEFRKVPGTKIEMYSSRIKCNGQKMDLRSCRTRGSSTLNYRRKSIAISLNEAIQLGDSKVLKLAINNLAMDQNYWRNRFSFLLMNQLGIFPIENRFAELIINGRTYGTYMAIQKPDDYVRSIQSPLLVRRGERENWIVEHEDGDSEKYLRQLMNLEKYPETLSGGELYDSLNHIIHMQNYFAWLAFNYLVSNGDYMDELFFYMDPNSKRFELIPWDYDDIFLSHPHEGWEERNKHLARRLLYSSESSFDLVINDDPVLYDRYLIAFENTLKILSPDVIKGVFEKVYQELLAFYSDPDIIQLSELDHFGLTNLPILRQDMEEHYNFLLRRHKSLVLKIGAERR